MSSVYRVTYDYGGNTAEELSLFRDDIVQVIKVIDRQWIHGYCNGFEGNFPSSCGTEVQFDDQLESTIAENQELFAAVNDFPCYESGDLQLRRGDLVLGLQQVDENWWKGRVVGTQREGIFPLTVVWKLRKDLLTINQSNGGHQHIGFAVVTQDMKARLEDELDLKKGEKVRLIKSVDKLYYKGELNGRIGIFPKAFVKLIEEEELQPSTMLINESIKAVSSTIDAYNCNDFETAPPSYNEVIQLGYSKVNTELSSYGQALFPFTAEYPNELSFKEGEIINLIRHVDDQWMEGELNGTIGVFPKSFISIIVDCDIQPELMSEQPPEEYPPATRARVMYEFNAQFEGDLTIKLGDIVTLTKKVQGDEWVEAVDRHGNTGICPRNFLEILDRDSVDVNGEVPAAVATPDTNLINFSPERELSSSSHTFTAPTIETPVYAEIRKASKNPVRPAPALPPKTVAVPVVNDHTVRSSVNSQSATLSTENVTQHNTNHNSSYSNTSTNGLINDEIERRNEERKKKVDEQRSVIIVEMLQSERDYLRDLKICYDIFMQNEKLNMKLKENNMNSGMLFGNLDEIIGVSERFVKSLEESTLCKKFENQLIGKCFIDIADEMRESYGHYCRNHDEVAVVWEKFDSIPDVKLIFQRGLEKIQRETNCFDIVSLLIKPVQRILKYPLLLNELLKCTSDDHEDKQDLEKATKLMADVAADINEFKRRKDLVFKYRKEENSSFSSKISKLNMHTLKKKSSRFGYRLSSTFGLSSAGKDEEFEAEVLKLRSMEKAIATFVKNLTAVMEQLEELVTTNFHISEEIAAFYDEKSNQKEVDELRRVQRLILTDFWEEMKKNMEENVAGVLKSLLSKFQAPNKLIDKRNDKLFDYIASNKRMESNKDPIKLKAIKEENSITKSVYEAMNKQLLDDLPKFSTYATQIFRDCIIAFIKIRKRFTGRTTREVLGLSDLPLLECSSIASVHDIIDTFTVKHNLVIDELLSEHTIIPKHVFPGAAAGGTSSLDRRQSSRNQKNKLLSSQFSINASSHSPQSQHQKLYLQNVYQQKLYIVTQDFNPVDILDLCAKKGDLVGVVKDKDPTGSSHRWFVDNGNSKGFIPNRLLQPSFPSSLSSSLENAVNLRHKSFPQLPNTSQTQASGSSNQMSLSQQFQRQTSSSRAVSDSKLLQMRNRDSLTESSLSEMNRVLPAPALPVRSQATNRPLMENQYEDVPENTTYENLMEFTDIDKSTKVTPKANLSAFDPLCSDANDEIGHRYEDVPDDRYEEIAADAPVEVNEFYYAMYNFVPVGEHQLPIKHGQVVLVKHKCDLRGNDEWWFVEDRFGSAGYVPKTYLALLNK